jgi:hypothetical protein
MFQPVFISVQHHEPRLAAFRRGMLRDQLGRQVEMKINSLHRESFEVQVWGFKLSLVRNEVWAVSSLWADCE